MSKIWQPQDKDTLLYWIKTIQDEASDKLSDWESNFIDSIDRQLAYKGQLSEQQEKILERIYAEKTA
jgi:hypothetical protein